MVEDQGNGPMTLKCSFKIEVLKRKVNLYKQLRLDGGEIGSLPE
jgi:hypothetical protein